MGVNTEPRPFLDLPLRFIPRAGQAKKGFGRVSYASEESLPTGDVIPTIRDWARNPMGTFSQPGCVPKDSTRCCRRGGPSRAAPRPSGARCSAAEPGGERPTDGNQRRHPRASGSRRWPRGLRRLLRGPLPQGVAREQEYPTGERTSDRDQHAGDDSVSPHRCIPRSRVCGVQPLVQGGAPSTSKLEAARRERAKDGCSGALLRLGSVRCTWSTLQ